MSKPVFEDLFSLSEVRRNRKSFVLAFLATLMMMCILAAGRGLVKDFMAPSDIKFYVVATLGFLLISSMWAFASVVGQRFRDFGWSGWWTLTVLMPPIFLILLLMLLFRAGNEGRNKYSSDPLGRIAHNVDEHHVKDSSIGERKDPHF